MPKAGYSEPLEENGGRSRGRKCPDCGGYLVRRNSVREHELMQRTYYQCRNLGCGATFLGVEEITHRMSPPRDPNPDVALPYCPHYRRKH